MFFHKLSTLMLYCRTGHPRHHSRQSFTASITRGQKGCAMWCRVTRKKFIVDSQHLIFRGSPLVAPTPLTTPSHISHLPSSPSHISRLLSPVSHLPSSVSRRFMNRFGNNGGSKRGFLTKTEIFFRSLSQSLSMIWNVENRLFLLQYTGCTRWHSLNHWWPFKHWAEISLLVVLRYCSFLNSIHFNYLYFIYRTVQYIINCTIRWRDIWRTKSASLYL